MPAGSGWLDVVIAVRDRPEVARTVASLAGSARSLGAIHVCDGGSAGEEGRAALAEAAAHPQVRVHRDEAPGFDKPRLLNAGISRCTAPYVLVSDADILWSHEALLAMRAALDDAPGAAVCCVGRVHETRRDTSALARPRYQVEVAEEERAFVVRVRPAAPAAGGARPGPGLVMARREAWLALGGYAPVFQGWGWEDQDLLVRARLLGMRVARAGEVTHLSHGEEGRNRFHGGRAAVATRDANIARSCRRLLAGQVVGPLGRGGGPAKPVTLELPPELGAALESAEAE